MSESVTDDFYLCNKTQGAQRIGVVRRVFRRKLMVSW